MPPIRTDAGAQGQTCHAGLASGECNQQHIAPELGPPHGRNYRCPAHDDHHASFSINPGTTVRIVWHCKAGCEPGVVRDALLALGIDATCLGKYGTARNVPGAPVIRTADCGIVADARRFQAVLKLPVDLNGMLLRMCVQAIADGDGDLPGDPERLLPSDYKEFISLAKRAGIERAYKYKLYRKWISGS